MLQSRTLALAVTAAASALSIGAAQAQITTVTTNGTFGPASGGSNVVISNSATPTNTDTIRWGTGGRSGLDFTGNSVAGPVAAGSEFSLGTLVYVNQPINPNTAITSTGFTTNTTFTYLGNNYSTGTLNFTIFVDETTNAAPCAYASTTPCADRIRIQPVAQAAIAVAGGTLNFFVDGFASTPTGTGQEFFIAQENASTTAYLVGHYTVRAVPEPATWALMITGFGAVGASMRRRNRTARPATV